MYVYEICPYCMDQLYERKQPIDDDVTNCCPKCGSRMECACLGEHKIDDTIYKIILNSVAIPNSGDKKNKFIEILMRIGKFNLEEAQRIYRTENTIIFEGNVSETYVNINLLEDFAPDIHYTVIPPFALESLLNPFLSICPICGNRTVTRTEDINNCSENIKSGIYCETCQDWIMFDICSKAEVDDTKYYVEVSLEEMDSEVINKIMHIYDGLCNTFDSSGNKRLEEKRIIVRDRAQNIEELLSALEDYNIPYEINPPYPHKIPESNPIYKNKWTEEEVRDLIKANPGLKVTVEELNALV